MDGVPGEVHLHAEEIRRGVVEGGLEGVVVEHLDADLIKIGNFSFVVGLGVFEDVEHVGVFGGEVGREDAFPCVEEILGGDGVAIRPAAVFAQLKGVNPTVGGYGP